MRRYGRLAPVRYEAEDPPHCCERPYAHGALAAVEVLAPVAHYGANVEMSYTASSPGKVGQNNVHRISATRKQVKLAKTKAAVARLPALIDAPAFDSINPAAHERLVPLGYKIEEGPAHNLSCGQETVVGAIVNWTRHRKPVEDKCSAYRLPRKGVEGDDTIWTGPASPAGIRR